VARAGPRGRGARPARPPHAFRLARACTADRGGARERRARAPRGGVAARSRTGAVAVLRRRVVPGRVGRRRSRRAGLRRLHGDRVPARLPPSRSAAAPPLRARLALARRRTAPARAPDDALARNGGSRPVRPPAGARPRLLPRHRPALVAPAGGPRRRARRARPPL